MADIEQEGFFRLIFDDADVKKKQIDLEKRTRQNKIAQKELNDEIKNVKKGTPEYDKLIEKSVKLKTEQKLNAKEQSEFNRELKNTAQAGKSMKELTKDVGNFKIKASDSYNEAIAKNNLLRQTLKQTKGAFGENSKEVDKLKSALNSNNDTLKKFDATTGVHVRNVGNYEGAISAVLNRLGPFGTIINNIRNDYSTLNNVLIQNTTATNANATAVTTATTANKGLSKSLKILRVALIATGIGAIVVVIGSLVAAFLSTQRGADALSKVMRPLGAVFDRVIGLVQNLSFFLVDKLKAAFNDPLKALKDLGRALLDNVINRFKATILIGSSLIKLFKGDWNSAVNGFIDGFAQFGTGVEGAADKITNAIADTALSIAEANKIGEEIDAITKKIEQSENDLILSRGRLNRAYEEANLLAKDQTKSDKERIAAGNEAERVLRELTDAEQALAKQKVELITLQQKLNDTDREGVAEKNRLTAQIEQNEADLNKKLGRIYSLRSGLLKKSLSEDQEAINSDYNLKLEKITALGPKEQELEKNNIDNIALAKESARQNEAIANDLFRAQELEKEQAFADNKQALTQSLFNSTKNLLSGLVAAETKSNEERAKARKEFLKGFLKDTISSVEAFLLTQIAKATAGALAQADSIASFGATGVARAAILTGLISAAGAGLRGLVDKFEDGGIAGSGDSVKIGGKDHSQGGTKFHGSDGSRFEAQKGEILTVVKRNDSNTLKALSQENVRRGGVDFFKGKRNSSFYQNGGVQVPLKNRNKIIKLDTDTLKAVISIEQLQSETNKFKTYQDAADF